MPSTELHKLHRLRTFAAKVTLVSRRVWQHFGSPDFVEVTVRNLPPVETSRELASKVVLVTGASQGVGLVLARTLREAKARVVLMGRHADPLERAARGFAADGPEPFVVVGDVSKASTADDVMAQVAEAVGPVDVLINNAGVGGPWGVPFWEADPVEFANAVDVNLTGAFLMARAAAKAAVARSRPLRIVNVSSIATETPGKGMAAYNGSKAGLESLTRAMAADGDAAGITVVTVSLHSVQTERKAAHDWASNALLPPASVVVPAFFHAITAPAAQVQGRVIASWRFLADAQAEAALAGPKSQLRPIAYPAFVHRGEEVARDPLRFSINDRAENPYGPHPRVLEAISDSLQSAPLSHYPEERHGRLFAALTELHGLDQDCFAVGPGSWEVLSRLVPLFAKPGETVVSHDPGWFGFNLVCQRSGVVQSRGRFALGENSGLPSQNLEDLLQRITPQTRLVYLIHPSNPEGVPLWQEEMDAFLDALPKSLPVIVDEAYIEYATVAGLFDTVAAVRTRANPIIGLRTFSKFHALAGARIGYAYARPALAKMIRNTENIFSVSSIAEAAAVAALGDEEHSSDRRKRFAEERDRLFDGLAKRNLAPVPSQAPFIMALRPDKADSFFDALEDSGIYLARYAFHGDRYMMFPVGLPKTTDAILGQLDRLVR